ncbi:preprotein translocase subunit TatC [Thermodesulfobacterium sp. TA1]|uniref:twin-arginine translocase subunit TatC n=1 Tax=Thermodesulfobacterium sp. TA1 TaxID=2234087 RepID=UPI0012327A86|nr:twin-arginine translocase subunit TatC [Thermodesulfobacterium sp. TA1]QER41569.1 preprotein translocase subunit TatC [Thermodesulfobacterium sp. TA1]
MSAKKIAKFIKFFLHHWKKRGFLITFLFLGLYLSFFWASPYLLNFLQHFYRQKFVFYSLSEPLISFLKFSLVLTFLVSFPLIFYLFLRGLNLVFNLKKKFFLIFYLLGLGLFYLGALFAYFITLPYGIKFLLSFRTEKIEPSISLGHFVNFFSFFVLAFGLIFELPLVLAFFSIIKVLNPYKITRYRREVFFGIAVISAMITPTPDAFNMALLAIPLYVLFELGVFLSKMLLKTNIITEIKNDEFEVASPENMREIK